MNVRERVSGYRSDSREFRRQFIELFRVYAPIFKKRNTPPSLRGERDPFHDGLSINEQCLRLLRSQECQHL
jgi:hypothetical protein